MDAVGLFSIVAGLLGAAALAAYHWQIAGQRNAKSVNAGVPYVRREARAVFYDEQARLYELQGDHEAAARFDELAGLARAGRFLPHAK